MTACLTTLLRPGTGALMQVADDEAASGAPERFAFRKRANVAQAFGHDAQAWAIYRMRLTGYVWFGLKC